MSAILRGNIRMALAGVRSAKWRSLLTMLGVIVGIVAVVCVVSIGQGIKRQVAGQLQHFGKDLITIRPGVATPSGSLASLHGSDVLFGMGSAGLSIHDAQEVAAASDVQLVAPLGVVPGTVSISGHARPAQLVIATSPDLPLALNHGLEQGEFWDPASGPDNAAVIGHNLAVKLFGTRVPLAYGFSFRGKPFVVRGIFAPFKSPPLSPTADFDNAIFIPYETAAELSHNNAGLYVMLAKAGSPKQLPTALGSITDRLRAAHGGQQDFSVLSPAQNVADSAQVVHLLTLWITAVAAISLAIGGVGIMNIMLLSVTERMHEIGVRKAIGASRRQILSQFVLEATVLSVVGGTVGMAVSLAAVGLLYVYTDLKPVIAWQSLAVATGVSLLIGIVFGVIPALKAAGKDPIDALRHE